MMVLLKPFTGRVLGAEPVQTMTSSNSRRSVAGALISIWKRTSMLFFFSSRSYQRSSALSASLKLMAAAVMYRPPSWPDFSKITGV